jgi:hypothetical protein
LMSAILSWGGGSTVVHCTLKEQNNIKLKLLFFYFK